MCVGTTTAIAIGAGVAAAGSVTAAKIGGDAATNAAKTQANSANNALGLQQQVYQGQVAAQQPYQQLGQQALGRLSSMQPSTAQFNPQNYSGGAPRMGTLAGMSQPQPQPQQISPQQAQPTGMGQGAQTPPGSGGAMVKLQAPDGSVRQFPQQQAQAMMIQAAQAKGQQLRIIP